MTNRRDVVLKDDLGNKIFPLAHATSTNELIDDTYFRKKVYTFILKSDKWEGKDGYFSYKIDKSYKEDTDYKDDEEVQSWNFSDITGEESPIWDIVVDATINDPGYKTQIKHRAWITTLSTSKEEDSEGNETGYIELQSMKQPSTSVTLLVKGINLNKQEEA